VSPRSVSSWLGRRLNLDVKHVDLLIHEHHGRPLSWFAPVLGVGYLVDVYVMDVGMIVVDPFPASFVDKGHEIPLASLVIGMIVIFIGPMIVIPFVHHHSDQSILPRRF
jgi:hypothetical protein